MSHKVAISPGVRLVHVSDVHFGSADPRALEAVASYVNETRPDAVLVAGDLTQNGRQREFRAARAWLESLSAPCIVTPGNHDTPGFNVPLRLYKRLSAPFADYRRFMSGFDCVGRLVELCDGRVRITGINTARGVQGRLNWADGVIDLADLDEALDLLSGGPGGAWRILLCHHPLREPGLSRISVDTRRGGHALIRCAAAHVDAILTGHVHDAFAHPVQGPRHHTVQMGSGTLSTRLRASQPSFCVVSIEDGCIRQEIVHISETGTLANLNYASH